MKTLLFKRSIMDIDFIRIFCKKWCSCKGGVSYIDLEGNSKFISTSEFYFWGVE